MQGFIEVTSRLGGGSIKIVRTSFAIDSIVRLDEDEHGKAIIHATWGSGVYSLKAMEDYDDVCEQIEADRTTIMVVE